MFCPRCGSNQPDELRFCKSCGANLHAVQSALAAPDRGEKFDWNKTWLAEMMLSGEESVRRAAEIERLQGLTPEAKRLNEIKAGVITASVGVGLMILLFVLMEGIIAGGRVSAAAAAILSRLWIIGVLPLLVGSALVFNGMFVSRRGLPARSSETESVPDELDPREPDAFLPPADTNELFPAGFSVTDETTKHLKQSR